MKRKKTVRGLAGAQSAAGKRSAAKFAAKNAMRVLASAAPDAAREKFAHYLLSATRDTPNILVADTTQPSSQVGALVILDQHYARGADTGQNRHEDFFALYVVQSGRGIHVINGHAYGVARGDVYITPPGTAHAYRDFDELRAVAFCFQAAFFREEELEALRTLPGFWDFLNATQNSAREYSQTPEFRDYRLHLSPEMYRETEDFIEEIKAESAPLHDSARRKTSTDSAAAPRILVRTLFFRLLVRLARWRHEVTQNAARPTSEVPREYSRASPDREMAALLQFCEENFDQPLGVPQMAARVFLSTARFSEVFAAHMGCPPAAYLRRLRLERAQMLLRETTLPISEIARRCGYGEAAQLSRAFRTAFKQTPTEYRAVNGRKK